MDSCKEIITGKLLKQKLLDGVNKLANVVTTTLGPNGNTVIIADEYGEPYITKDGVSVSNYITLQDAVENIAATLLKQVAKKTVELAGDGTTTATVLAQYLISRGFNLIANEVPYSVIKEQLEELEKIVIQELSRTSKELEQSNIVNVATISSNNDIGVGKLIQDAFNHSTIVRVVEGNSLEDTLVTISGMELDTGLFDNAFITDGTTQTVNYNDPVIILVGGYVTTLDNIAALLQAVGTRPVIIIADHFHSEVVSILKTNFNKNILNVALVKSPGFAGHRKNLMEDIAMYTGATLLEPSTKYKDFNCCGSLTNITVGKSKCTLLKEGLNISLEKKLEDLNIYKSALDKESSEITLVEQRIENLTGKIAIIEVGGTSEVEMKERKDRIDDAVLAVSCALDEGIISGGGVALLNIYLENTLQDNKFKGALIAPYNKIRENGCDVAVASQEDMIAAGIIDPAKVTRVALQNAISVAKTILNTDAVVLNPTLWK